MKRIFSLCALLMIFSSAALADIRLPDTPKPTPAPKEKKSIMTGMTIKIDKNAKEARLLIPKSQLQQLRAELDQLDDNSNAATTGLTRTQTIVGGLFLSLGMVFGGVWLARFRKKDLKPNKMVAAGAVLFFSGALATLTFANVGPPPEARSLTGKIFTPAVHRFKRAWGRVRIEVADDTGDVELIVPDVEDDKVSNE